jgi:hypothetical protein
MSITITVAGKTFLTSGVSIGHEMVVTDVTNPTSTPAGVLLADGSHNPILYEQLLVTEVVSETSLKFDAYSNGTALGLTDANLNLASTEHFTFSIVQHLSTDQQVDHLVAIASSYDSERVLMIWPPEAEWDQNGTVVNGSTMAAICSAAMSVYPAQQGFTNLSFSGPYNLHYSNTYFTPAQLNRLSAAGFFVLVQDTPGAEVYCRHQKTTSQSAEIARQEFSITKGSDKVGLDLYNTVKPYIGKYNITQDLLTAVNEVIGNYLFKAKSTKAPFCGSLIIDYSNLSLRANLDGENTDLPKDTIEISVTIEMGYPANYIDILLYVQ